MPYKFQKIILSLYWKNIFLLKFKVGSIKLCFQKRRKKNLEKENSYKSLSIIPLKKYETILDEPVLRWKLLGESHKEKKIREEQNLTYICKQIKLGWSKNTNLLLQVSKKNSVKKIHLRAPGYTISCDHLAKVN